MAIFINLADLAMGCILAAALGLKAAELFTAIDAHRWPTTLLLFTASLFLARIMRTLWRILRTLRDILAALEHPIDGKLLALRGAIDRSRH